MTANRQLAKREEVAQAAVRLVGTRPKDDFTLIETIIDEIRSLPEDEKTSAQYYSTEGQEVRRHNERLAAGRVVAFEQLAAACLANDRLRFYLRKAGL